MLCWPESQKLLVFASSFFFHFSVNAPRDSDFCESVAQRTECRLDYHHTDNRLDVCPIYCFQRLLNVAKRAAHRFLLNGLQDVFFFPYQCLMCVVLGDVDGIRIPGIATSIWHVGEVINRQPVWHFLRTAETTIIQQSF